LQLPLLRHLLFYRWQLLARLLPELPLRVPLPLVLRLSVVPLPLVLRLSVVPLPLELLL
jgi:hypothetical protein